MKFETFKCDVVEVCNVATPTEMSINSKNYDFCSELIPQKQKSLKTSKSARK